MTLDKAFASLDDVPLRELEAIAAVLGRRRDVLARFSSVFRDVAFARRSGGEARLGRFHLRDCVSRGGDELADRLADAPAPFWRDMRDALGVHQDSFPEEGGLA